MIFKGVAENPASSAMTAQRARRKGDVAITCSGISAGRQKRAGTRIVALVRNSSITDISITTLKFSYAGEQYSASVLDLLTVSERNLSAPLAQLDHLKAALTNAVDFIFVD